VAGCVGIGSIVACYGIYVYANPGADGVIFASILAAVSAMVTATIAYCVATKAVVE